jgi:hypothetical protein|nr:MAG TPA: hypothetical protein [Caudoviricetes sp.]
MKKIEKADYIIRMMAAAIEDAKEKFFNENKEEFNKISFNIYDQDEEETLIALMVSSYDYSHRHLVSNWLYNAYDGASEFMKSKKLEYICDELEVDMPHFTWNQEDLIHKIRFIQILERDEIEHLNAPRKYILCKERGYEYDLFKRKVYPIEKAWVSWKEGGEN